MWVATLSSRGSSRPKDQTQVSYIAGKFFTILATREGHVKLSQNPCDIPLAHDLYLPMDASITCSVFISGHICSLVSRLEASHRQVSSLSVSYKSYKSAQ